MVGWLSQVLNPFLMESQRAALKASGRIRKVVLKHVYPVKVSDYVYICRYTPFTLIMVLF